MDFSCTLGSVCDSPSSCFIASDGKKLSVYQAVVDAASILAEMYSSNKKNVDASFDRYNLCFLIDNESNNYKKKLKSIKNAAGKFDFSDECK